MIYNSRWSHFFPLLLARLNIFSHLSRLFIELLLLEAYLGAALFRGYVHQLHHMGRRLTWRAYLLPPFSHTVCDVVTQLSAYHYRRIGWHVGLLGKALKMTAHITDRHSSQGVSYAQRNQHHQRLWVMISLWAASNDSITWAPSLTLECLFLKPGYLVNKAPVC